jgi:chromosome segregation ATPase
MNTDTPETDAMVSADQHHLEDDNFFSASVYWRMCDLARRIERERDELQKAVNGLCNHLQVSPANTTLLAVEILKIERERDEAQVTIEDAKRALNATDYEGILLAAMRVKEERDEALHQMEKYAAEAKLAIDAHESAFRERNQTREQRDKLAEALRVATAYPLSDSWYKQAIEALATLKPCD